MQPFNIELFQQGANMVNDMLLKRLRAPDCRGDISPEVEQFKALHMKRRQCDNCKEWRHQSKEFSRNVKNNGNRKGSHQCVHCDATEGTPGYKQHTKAPHPCSKCKRHLGQDKYSTAAWQNRVSREPLCNACKAAHETWPCEGCEDIKTKDEWIATRSKAAWEKRKNKKRPLKCTHCKPKISTYIYPRSQ